MLRLWGRWCRRLPRTGPIRVSRRQLTRPVLSAARECLRRRRRAAYHLIARGSRVGPEPGDCGNVSSNRRCARCSTGSVALHD